MGKIDNADNAGVIWLSAALFTVFTRILTAAYTHVLRHTLLRKLAEAKGVQYAMEASGHKTDRYIWRYVQPSSQDLADAIDELE
jgi:hypothetical protein